MKRSLLIMFSVFLFTDAMTQMTQYSTANSGLVCDMVISIAVDKYNNKWFGTYQEGVSKFDGSTWTTYNSYNTNNGLLHNDVNAIVCDTLGNVWFGTGNGVSKFDGVNWTTYQHSNSGLVCDYIISMAIDVQGNKWFGTNNGVSKFNGSSWSTYTESSSGLAGSGVWSIAIDTSGNPWFGTDHGVSMLNEVTCTNYTLGCGNNCTPNIAVDKKNKIWVTTNNPSGSIYNGAIEFDGTDWISISTSNSGLVSDGVYSIAVDPQDNKWFGMNNGTGVSMFDGSNWTTYNNSYSGLTAMQINVIAIDNRNHKWFGTEKGVFELSPAETNEIFYCYPNPATDEVTIATEPNSIVEILNTEGQCIKKLTSEASVETIDISSLSQGVYFIKVVNDQGNASEKFIKL